MLKTALPRDAAAHNSSLRRVQPMLIKRELTPDPVKPRVALLAADPPDNATASNRSEPDSPPAGCATIAKKINEADIYEL
ncbi:hypothetical protein CN179_14950 [Sinorhizobium medicae]|nr:hypothetical protein CN179_14950 [Sinorhizobium medicae]